MSENSTIQFGSVILERYKIQQSLGAGSHGAVYSAMDLVLNRQVAIKFLETFLPNGGELDLRQRFEREAKALSMLSHENIIRVYSYQLLETKKPILVMELASGLALNNLISSSSPLSLVRSIEIAKQILRGLQAIHEAGIVHRDLKPQNILIDTRENKDFVKIIDFGLCRAEPRSSKLGLTLTETGLLVGTVNYMSPEQCSGQVATNQADIYSFGIVFFEMLVGYPPFGGNNPLAILFKHVSETVPQLTKVSQKCPVTIELDLILAKCLAKAKQRRYESCQEIVSDLDKILDLGIDPEFRLLESSKGRKGNPFPTSARLFSMWIFGLISILALASLLLFTRFGIESTTKIIEYTLPATLSGNILSTGLALLIKSKNYTSAKLLLDTIEESSISSRSSTARTIEIFYPCLNFFDNIDTKESQDFQRSLELKLLSILLRDFRNDFEQGRFDETKAVRLFHLNCRILSQADKDRRYLQAIEAAIERDNILRCIDSTPSRQRPTKTPKERLNLTRLKLSTHALLVFASCNSPVLSQPRAQRVYGIICDFFHHASMAERSAIIESKAYFDLDQVVQLVDTTQRNLSKRYPNLSCDALRSHIERTAYDLACGQQTVNSNSLSEIKKLTQQGIIPQANHMGRYKEILQKLGLFKPNKPENSY